MEKWSWGGDKVITQPCQRGGALPAVMRSEEQRCPPEGCWQERSRVTYLALVFRMWPHLCGLNVGGL